jgi:hypothetical protein
VPGSTVLDAPRSCSLGSEFLWGGSGSREEERQVALFLGKGSIFVGTNSLMMKDHFYPFDL